MKQYDPALESCGLDEANLDITDYLKKNGLDGKDGRMFLAQKIRQEIFEKMQMTCSAGVAPNKMLAKICSELDKPDGLTYMQFDEKKILEFMKERKVRDIPGVGSVQESLLAGIGIVSCQDILEKAAEIYVSVTEHQFEFLVKASLGIARAQHEVSDIAKKSVSVSKSFRPISRKDQFVTRINDICSMLE